MLSALFGSAPGALSQVIAHAAAGKFRPARHRDRADRPRRDPHRLPAGGAGRCSGSSRRRRCRAPAISRSCPNSRSWWSCSTVRRDRCALAEVSRRPDFGAMMASAVLHGTGLIHAAMPWWIVAAVMVGLGAHHRIALRQYRSAPAAAAISPPALGSFAVVISIVDGLRGGRGLALSLRSPTSWCRSRRARSTP